MFRAAVLVILFGFAIRFAPALPGPLTVPELLAAGVAVSWLLWGPIFGVAVATTAWSVLNLAWSLDDRLAPVLAGQDIIVAGTICDFPRDDGRARRFTLHLTASPIDPRLPARLYLGSYGAMPGRVAGGQVWQLKVRLKRPRGLANPGGFDFERWALERRVGATGYVRASAANRLPDARHKACPSMRWRQYLAAGVDRVLGPGRAARFLPALAVGARHRLRQEDWKVLRRTGTVHLMAISGLHIGLVAGLMLWLGRGLASVALLAGVACSPLAVGRAFALAGATLYASLAGFSVPTTRALVMVGVIVTMATAGRMVGAWRILAVAALAVIWVDPFAMLGAGFWLSFGAVAVLLLRGLGISGRKPVTEGFVRRWSYRLRTLVRMQLSLSLGLAPLALLFFAEVSLVSPFVNVVVVPLFALLIVPLTLLGTVSVALAPFAAAPLLGAAATVLESSLALLTPLAGWPGAAWRQALPDGSWVLATGLGALLLAWPRPLRCRGLGILPIVAVAAGLTTRPAPQLRMVVMDVGQGLAVLVQTPDHVLLYDTGPGYGRRDAGQTVVLPVLNHFGVTRLDALVVSHGDNDHAGGARTILDAFPNATLIATDGFGLGHRARQSCRAGLTWRWNGAHFRVLHPGDWPRKKMTDDNDRSCVLSVTIGRASLLLPGDVERQAEAQLVADGSLRETGVVIAPHHGSSTSSSEPFIRVLNPRMVVFSSGFANRWGFPDGEVQARWRAGGACLLDTAVTGALVFEARANGVLKLATRQRASGRRIWTEGDPPGDPCTSTNYHGARL
ncbi:MAG: DNA internalization-related competence protein ComEC/Rec2 [Gammaproteobacteria bacterium]